MKKLAVLLALIIALTALCLPMYADNVEAETEAVFSDEPIPLGTFTVLHALYNRGTGHHEIYLMREGDGDISNIFRVDMDDLSDGEALPCEVTSDGSADGDSAKLLFETAREIKPGTMVALYADPAAPESFYSYFEDGEYEYVPTRTIAKISFGSLWRNPDPEHIAGVYSQLNECVIYAQDRRVQFEYEVIDGEIFVERVEVEPFENDIEWINRLWVLYSEQNGGSLTLILGVFNESKLTTFAYLVTAENWALDAPSVGDLVSVLPTERVTAPSGQFEIEDLKIELSDEFVMDKELNKEEVIDKLNDRLAADGSQTRYVYSPSGRIQRIMSAPAQTAASPDTVVTFALLPIIPALAALIISQKRR